MVYVDKLTPCIPTADWQFRFSCHLVADDVDELLDFANRLGLKKEWFQYRNKKIPHFDLGVKYRQKALQYGAIPIDNKKLHELIMKYEVLKSADKNNEKK